MFHPASETSLFQCSGILISTFIRACFDFLGKKQGGGKFPRPRPAPNATALQTYRENKRLRSYNRVSVVGLDILFQNLDSFWEFIFR